MDHFILLNRYTVQYGFYNNQFHLQMFIDFCVCLHLKINKHYFSIVIENSLTYNSHVDLQLLTAISIWQDNLIQSKPDFYM